jgi:hypothetical protein
VRPFGEELPGQAGSDLVSLFLRHREKQTNQIRPPSFRARSLDKRVDAYQRLRRHLDNYRRIPVLDFDRAVAAQFESYRFQERKLRECAT